MIRLLTAVFLFANSAVAQPLLPHLLSDGQVASASQVMDNFNALADEIASHEERISWSETAIGNNFTKLPPSDCSLHQIIKWNGSAWVCATDPLTSLSCDEGDQLRMGDGGWECRAEPITASLIQDFWINPNSPQLASALFDSLNNIDASSFCNTSFCGVEVVGVTDHASCSAWVTGGAVSGDATLIINNTTNSIEIRQPSFWNQGQAVYINISCTP